VPLITSADGGMADQEDWTPGDVAGMLANPFYAINIDEGLALSHEPLISEDDWVKANVGLIKELGQEAHLRPDQPPSPGRAPRTAAASASLWAANAVPAASAQAAARRAHSASR